MTLRCLIYAASYLPHLCGIVFKAINRGVDFYFCDIASFVMLLICYFSEKSMSDGKKSRFDYAELLLLINVIYSALMVFCNKLGGVLFLPATIALTLLGLTVGCRLIIKHAEGWDGNVTHCNGAHILSYIVGYACIALFSGFINDSLLKTLMCECVAFSLILQDWFYHTKLKSLVMYSYKTFIVADTLLILSLTTLAINVPEWAICHFIAILHPVIVTKLISDRKI